MKDLPAIVGHKHKEAEFPKGIFMFTISFKAPRNTGRAALA
jgi:hypothetical protein